MSFCRRNYDEQADMELPTNGILARLKYGQAPIKVGSRWISLELLDHPVGAQKDRLQDRKIERFGGSDQDPSAPVLTTW
jgi:hypothetical protein